MKYGARNNRRVMTYQHSIKKNSKIEVIHIHKHTEDSLQLTELISGWKSEKFIQKKAFSSPDSHQNLFALKANGWSYETFPSAPE